MESDLRPRKRRPRRRLRRLIALALLAAAFMLALPWIGLWTRAEYNRVRFGIETLHSPNDRDGDGLDDWSDLMLSARRYVGSKPVYDADYYDGYPPEGRGVCADVIWRALKAAGYDLKALIDRDIAAAPQSYALTGGVPDSNIDFRRVSNLAAYFARYGQTLTNDTSDAAAWQPGDFVVYDGRIAVISDRRNASGVPFVIHHTGHGAFEEDALTTRPIIEHYRWIAPDQGKE